MDLGPSMTPNYKSCLLVRRASRHHRHVILGLALGLGLGLGVHATIGTLSLEPELDASMIPPVMAQLGGTMVR